MGDEVWRVLLGEGMLATCLSFGELTRLARLNRSSRRLHDAAWRAIWRARSKACSGAELAHILRLAITKGKVAHVRELVRPMTEQGDASVLMQAIDGEPSYLFLAVKKWTLEVVRALLEAGGRELLMLTADDDADCGSAGAEPTSPSAATPAPNTISCASVQPMPDAAFKLYSSPLLSVRPHPHRAWSPVPTSIGVCGCSSIHLVSVHSVSAVCPQAHAARCVGISPPCLTQLTSGRSRLRLCRAVSTAPSARK